MKHYSISPIISGNYNKREICQGGSKRKRKDGTLLDMLVLGFPLVIEGKL